MSTRKTPHGGARKGAGRKLSAATQLRRMMEQEKLDEAEKSFNFLVQTRDDENVARALRVECAEKIMDRIMGKPKQSSEITGKDGGPVVFRLNIKGTDGKIVDLTPEIPKQ